MTPAGDLAVARTVHGGRAAAATVPADAAGSAWTEALGSATAVLNAIGSLWIFGLMCMMLADLGGRFLFDRPIAGVAEVAGLSIVGIIYLQLGATVLGGRMTRADFVADWIARKAPRFGHVLSGLFQLLGLATMAGLAWVSVEPFVSAWSDQETLGTAGVFLVATWPFRGMLLLGSALAALCYLTLAVRDFARAVRPPEGAQPPPLARGEASR